MAGLHGLYKATWAEIKTAMLAYIKADTDVADAISKKHAASGQFNQATAAEISAMTDKATPVDADVFVIEDSATTPTAFGKKKLTWSNLKTTLGSLFVSKVSGSSLVADTEISKIHTAGTDQGLDTGGANAVTAAQAKAGYTHSQAAHAPSNAVALATVKADTDIADAISKKHSNSLDHSQNTDSGTTSQTFSLFSGSVLGRWIFSVVTGAGNYLLTLQNAVLTANRTQTYQNDDGTIALTKNLPLTTQLEFSVNGQLNVILAGNYGGYYKIPYAGTITGWVLYEGSSTPIATTTVLDVWKKSSFYPTVADTIFGTKPSLTAATNNSAAGLNIAVAAGDIFAFNVDSNTAGKILNFMLLITKS